MRVDEEMVSPHGPAPGFWRFDEDDSSSEEDDVPAEGDSDNDSDRWDYQAYDWEGLRQATEGLSAMDRLGAEYEKQVNDIGELLQSQVIIELIVDI